MGNELCYSVDDNGGFDWETGDEDQENGCLSVFPGNQAAGYFLWAEWNNDQVEFQPPPTHPHHRDFSTHPPPADRSVSRQSDHDSMAVIDSVGPRSLPVESRAGRSRTM